MNSLLQSILMKHDYLKGLNVVRLAFIWFALVVCMVVGACQGGGDNSASYETRAIALDKSLMCPVCPGESLDQSQTQLAYQMKSIIRVKIEEGWADKQILDYFVERYSSSVLLEPQTEGVSLLVWIVPPVGVLLALTVLILVLRGKVTRDNSEGLLVQEISLSEELDSSERSEARNED
jgi:cytochrome c-type biogenesis protein CcmH